MIKVADKPSQDPIQQKLRLLKKQWNKDVSAFIDNLIHYKKLTNGQPNKFYKERSSIKEPIPADPSTIMGSLSGDFQELVQRGNSIIAAQIDYSKTRRKSQPKMPATNLTSVDVPNTPPSNDLSKQLATFEYKYDLVSEASNSITRLFTKLLNPTFGLSEAARIRRYRMNLLDATVAAYKDLGKLQVSIVSGSSDSLTQSNKVLHKVWNDWMLVYRGFTTYKSNMPKMVSDTGGEIPTPTALIEEKNKTEESKKEPIVTPALEEKTVEQNPENAVDVQIIRVKEIISDYQRNYKKLDESQMGGYDSELEAFITKFLKLPAHYKFLFAPKVIESYNKVIANLNYKLGTNGNSMGDIFTQLKTKNKTASERLEVLSQDFLKKWLGKTKYQLSTDKTSSYRLDIYKMAGEVRRILDQIMNSLEKEMNIEALDPLILQVNRHIISMRGLMRALHNTNTSTTKSQNSVPDDSWISKMDML